jgi:hypothetical protein
MGTDLLMRMSLITDAWKAPSPAVHIIILEKKIMKTKMAEVPNAIGREFFFKVSRLAFIRYLFIMEIEEIKSINEDTNWDKKTGKPIRFDTIPTNPITPNPNVKAITISEDIEISPETLFTGIPINTV